MGRTFENRKQSMMKTSTMKAKLYSKYGKEIYVIAKNGGYEVDGNPGLRRIIDKAKKEQVPSHVIENAIKKAKGGAGEDYVPARYEGYGPGGTMVIVDCLTDNNNRTIAELRNCFTKCKCKMGGPGSVAHMFEHQAIFSFAGDDDEGEAQAVADGQQLTGRVVVFRSTVHGVDEGTAEGGEDQEEPQVVQGLVERVGHGASGARGLCIP